MDPRPVSSTCGFETLLMAAQDQEERPILLRRVGRLHL